MTKKRRNVFWDCKAQSEQGYRQQISKNKLSLTHNSQWYVTTLVCVTFMHTT